MTIRQSIATFYGIIAIVFLGLQAMPVVSNAMTTMDEALEIGLPIDADATGHPEIDDLPAYLTDGGNIADL